MRELLRFLKRLGVRFSLLWIVLVCKKINIKFENILVLSPHPDDEVIGVGGLILQTLGSGKKVHIVYLTDGEGSWCHPDKERIKKERSFLTDQVLREFQIPPEQIYRLNLKDGGVPRINDESFSEASDRLIKIIDETKPDVVLATHFLDKFSDHIACFELAKDAVPKANHRATLRLYWVWAWYRLCPWDIFKVLKAKRINIRPQYAKKKELMDIYLLPKSPTGTPWSGSLPKMMLTPLFFETIEEV